MLYKIPEYIDHYDLDTLYLLVLYHNTPTDLFRRPSLAMMIHRIIISRFEVYIICLTLNQNLFVEFIYPSRQMCCSGKHKNTTENKLEYNKLVVGDGDDFNTNACLLARNSG